MASSDWTTALQSLSTNDVYTRPTTGTTKPNGGGNFVLPYVSLTNAPGASARYVNGANFAPVVSGAEITFAVARLASGGVAGWSAFAFAGLQGTSVNDECYMLGLSDNEASLIELRKGPLVNGLPHEEPGGANGILRRSTIQVPIGEWVHLKLEVVVQQFGDVYLRCLMNDLGANTVAAPVWEEIPGLELDYNDLAVSFIDDGAGINSGSLPLVGGRVGVGVRVDDVTRRAAFDHITVARQTAP